MFDKEFRGKVALVTGASGGIGKVVARMLAELGVVVALSDRDKDELKMVVNDLRSFGFDVYAVEADVCSNNEIKMAVDEVENKIGPIFFLVNVAGLLCIGSILEMNDIDWDLSFSINSRGVFLFSKEVAKKMMPRKGGSIVTVTSNAAHVPRVGMSAYAASKSSASMFMKCLGLEMAGYGIRCNVVAPGSTDTPMLRSMWIDNRGPEKTLKGDLDDFRVGIPLARIASPEDIANAVIFFLSERSSHITMEELVVDGGASLGV